MSPRRRRLCASLTLLLPFLTLFGHAEIIDRVVAVVEKHIITLSDVRQERNIREALGDKVDADETALIRQLVDDYLIETQMGDFPEVSLTDEEFVAQFMRVASTAETVNTNVRDALRRRIRMARYFDARFRQFIRPSDEDIKKYYEEVFVPAARGRGMNPLPQFDEISDAVRDNVIEERLDHEVNIWLEAIRRRSFIEIVQ